MTNNRSRVVKVIGVAAFFGVALVLLAITARLAIIRRSVHREFADLKGPHDQMQLIADDLQLRRNQAANDKQLILNLLGLCRVAEDVPDFQSDRIIAHHTGFDKSCFYVPAGTHSLEISSSWGPNATRDTAPPAGEKTWTVPLLPASGYFFTLKTDRKGEPIEWTLTGNHPQFESQQGHVPLDAFLIQSSSWSGPDILQFPNQLEHFSIRTLETAAKAPLGTELINLTFTGRRADELYQVAIKLRILSEGPVCVSATGAQQIIVQDREDLLLPYQGGGKYDIRSPAP